MAKNYNFLQEFIDSLNNEIFEVFQEKGLMTKESAEASAYALHDIAESIVKIYQKIIPKIIEKENDSQEYLEELLFNLKDEFSHILYHIEDAKLYGLKYGEGDSPNVSK